MANDVRELCKFSRIKNEWVFFVSFFFEIFQSDSDAKQKLI